MQSIRYFTLFSLTTILACCTPSAVNNRKDTHRERATGSNSQGSRPNIILIMSDDMGYSDLSSYGGEIETPVLNSLAENGLRFSQFYNTARCCPTRASLLTGLYPAQTGLGFMTADENMPGYRGEIGSQCVTIAEVLKQAGYRTYMSGKWHVARNLKDIDSLKYNWPLQRGFDKFYGTIIGAGSHWDPWTLTRNNEYITPFNDPEYKPEQQWYYTDAISDNAAKYIEEHTLEAKRDPFFIYVSYTAPHWPLHAPDDEIALHKGKYDDGPLPIRKKRYERLKSSGLIDESWPLSEPAAQWDTIQSKVWHSRNMEVYAAMITRMDKGIGKIVDKLKEEGMLDTTLILYLQDNGGCAETLHWIRHTNVHNELSSLKAYEPMSQEELQMQMFPKQNREGFPVTLMDEKVMAGDDQTYHAYGPIWANVSNTPFREFKQWVHEGGIATPLIAHWPSTIKDHGGIRSQPSHVIDIMATVVDIAGATYPSEYDGNAIVSMEGKSLLGVFTNNDAIEREAIYFEHGGNRAVRKGEWKLVSKANVDEENFAKLDTLRPEHWELFNMKTDRTETVDLARKHPHLVKELSLLWHQWAERTHTIPKP